MTERPLRVLVVDDSVTFRKVVRDVLKDVPNVEVVGFATNGRVAIEKVELIRPDLLTLDIDMPEVDGIGVLRELIGRNHSTGVIMLSALTRSGARLTAKALELGAFDFVLKPSRNSLEQNVEELRRELLPKVAAFSAAQRRATPISPLPTSSTAKPTGVASCVPEHPRADDAPAEIVVIGSSTGGPAALSRVVSQLPADFPLPILIVQHMPPMFTKSMADNLCQVSQLDVREAADGEFLKPGHVRIAPGGSQLKLDLGMRLRVTDDPAQRGCKPSVDYLLFSVANACAGKVIAVIMTGVGDDGALGCTELKRRGATIIAQDRESCVVYGMPRQVVELGLADVVCPLDDIHRQIRQRVERGRTLCS